MHGQVNRVQGPQGNTDTLPTLPTLLMGADLTSKQRQLLPWTLGCSAEAVRGRAAAVDVQLMMELSPQKTIRSLNALSGNCTSSTLPQEPHNTAMQGALQATAGFSSLACSPCLLRGVAIPILPWHWHLDRATRYILLA